MEQYTEAFVRIDTAKNKHALAIADPGRDGEIRYLGEIDSAPAAVQRMIRKLAGRYEKLYFCYEAGPTGYGLYRQVRALGHDCIVVAPSLVPKRPWSSVISDGILGAYVEAILISRGAVRKSRWNLIASEHALVRFLERSGADLEAAMVEANRECARGRFHRLPGGTETIVKAGPGAFVGLVEPGEDGSGVMTARTWLHADQLREDQEQKLMVA
jgi:hypothetical protein